MKNKQIEEVAPYLNILIKIGSIMIMSILGGFLLGLYFGKKMGYPKTVLIVGTLTGIFSGFWLVYVQCLKKL